MRKSLAAASSADLDKEFDRTAKVIKFMLAKLSPEERKALGF